MSKTTDPRKYKAVEHIWVDAREAVLVAKDSYTYESLKLYENEYCTPHELRREFWERLAHFCGFKIEWPAQEPTSEGDSP